MSKLIDAGDAFYAVKYLDSFAGIDLDRTADELVDTKNYEYLLDNLDKFPGVDHDRIAKRLLDLPALEAVSGNLAKFKGLSSEVALRLVKMGRASRIAANMSSFQLDPTEFYVMVADKCRNFMDKAEKEAPQLAEQARKNVVVLCGLLEGGNKVELMKEMADENIFLCGALENNPRYGGKLFLKYYEFGKEAQENVSTLYRFKQELLADKPDLDPQSAEFRQLMQGKLAGFKNNAAIKSEIGERTSNGSWFDYGESVRFALGGESADFNEQVHLPIDRMSDFANNFKKTVLGVLAQFEPELRNSHAVDARELELADYITRLEGQLASAERDGDADRAIRIGNGLAGARAKQEKAKPQSVWEKIRSDMRKLGFASLEMEKLRGCCARDEEEIAKLADGKDRTRLAEAKAQLGKDKRALRERFGELVSSTERSVNSLEATLARPLGPERAQALVQEINQQLAEDFSHFDADRNSLASVFETEVGRDSLAGTDMSVRIASRDPDTDLYLGNYCPCCICIESGYHGSESPISDYVTDLGMQNVVVYDEKRRIPVAACWCFLGENKGERRVKLVVDNIEANTDYSGRYPEQIGAAIRRFIEEYARACGIDTQDIIQGPDNNDLEIFETGKVSRKLGGLYNKPEGYFLEALEDEDD